MKKELKEEEVENVLETVTTCSLFLSLLATRTIGLRAWFDYAKICVYQLAVFCVDCLPEGAAQDEVIPIYQDQEWDYIPVCAKCGRVHEVRLTEVGQKVEKRDPYLNY
jgi:hypothetical protein